MIAKRGPGRPRTRTTDESREAIAALAKYWIASGRKFSYRQMAFAVYGDYSGNYIPFIIQSIESSGVAAPKRRRKSAAKLAKQPSHAPIANFVVTTHTHS